MVLLYIMNYKLGQKKTIQIFNDEVESLFSNTFSTYKTKKNAKNTKKESSKKPQYISDYEESKKS